MPEANIWLIVFHSQCMQASRKSGIELECGCFVPHVSIAIIKKWKKNSQSYTSLALNVKIPGKQIVPYESILYPEVAQYYVIEFFDLNVDERITSS